MPTATAAIIVLLLAMAVMTLGVANELPSLEIVASVMFFTASAMFALAQKGR